MINSEELCPCCSGNLYSSCCKHFHEGSLPQNALELMRSRYSAYALALVDYIIETTHPANSQYLDDKLSWRQEIALFSQSSIFHKLKILDFKENKSGATVIFTAYISQGDDDMTFTEKSYFEKINHRWLYKSGQVKKG